MIRPSRGLPPVECLARGQSEKSGELPPAGKRAEVLDRGEKRRGGDRADPGNGHQPPRGLVGLGGGFKLPVDRLDCFVERVDLPDKREEGEAHAVGNHDLAVPPPAARPVGSRFFSGRVPTWRHQRSVPRRRSAFGRHGLRVAVMLLGDQRSDHHPQLLNRVLDVVEHRGHIAHVVQSSPAAMAMSVSALASASVSSLLRLRRSQVPFPAHLLYLARDRQWSAAPLRKDFNFGGLRYNRKIEDRVPCQCPEVLIGAGDGATARFLVGPHSGGPSASQVNRLRGCARAIPHLGRHDPHHRHAGRL